MMKAPKFFQQIFLSVGYGYPGLKLSQFETLGIKEL